MVYCGVKRLFQCGYSLLPILSFAGCSPDRAPLAEWSEAAPRGTATVLVLDALRDELGAHVVPSGAAFLGVDSLVVASTARSAVYRCSVTTQLCADLELPRVRPTGPRGVTVLGQDTLLLWTSRAVFVGLLTPPRPNILKVMDSVSMEGAIASPRGLVWLPWSSETWRPTRFPQDSRGQPVLMFSWPGVIAETVAWVPSVVREYTILAETQNRIVLGGWSGDTLVVGGPIQSTLQGVSMLGKSTGPIRGLGPGPLPADVSVSDDPVTRAARIVGAAAFEGLTVLGERDIAVVVNLTASSPESSRLFRAQWGRLQQQAIVVVSLDAPAIACSAIRLPGGTWRIVDVSVNGKVLLVSRESTSSQRRAARLAVLSSSSFHC